MIILGLDMATRTGWSIYDTTSGKVLESGVQDFSRRRGECGNGAMFMRVRAWLEKTIGYLPGIDLVAYEQAHHRGGPATELLVGMTTRVQEIGTKYGIPVTPVKTHEVKKFAKGLCMDRGEIAQPGANAVGEKAKKKKAIALVGPDGEKLTGKAVSIRAATLVLGRQPIDDNEADAIMVAMAAAADHAPGSKAA